MKIKLELFGASKEFSDKEYLSLLDITAKISNININTNEFNESNESSDHTNNKHLTLYFNFA